MPRKAASSRGWIWMYFKKSREDREFAKLKSYDDFARKDMQLYLNFYLHMLLLLLNNFALSEGLSFPSLIKLSLYGQNMSPFQSKTIQQSRSEKDYINSEFV